MTQAINLERLPEELYGGQDTELHERGLRGFTMLFQYVQLFNSLERMGFNTTDLTLFRLLTEQILTDACNWVSLLDMIITQKYTRTVSSYKDILSL